MVSPAKAAQKSLSPKPLFQSFWLAGYEGACHINGSGSRLDMAAITHHDQQISNDYALLNEFGIRTIREGTRWPLIEHDGRYDFSSLAPMVEAATKNDLQVIWTLCHYGWPQDVDIFAPSFIDRFAKYCKAVAQYIADQTDAVPFYTPINEISFLSWAICHTGLIHPYVKRGKHRDRELKQQLVRAVIAGCEAIWEVDARARIVHVDPIIHIIAPPDRPDLIGPAAALRASQFEAWDMIAGKTETQLGGNPKYLDIIGANYYHDNQWEYLTNDRLQWHLKDPRRLPLHVLLSEVYQRYGCHLFIGETSHIGVGRGEWITEIAEEVGIALRNGVPLEGICLYPILDRPDWENLSHWHNSGLWDLPPDGQGRLHRVLNESYATDLHAAQRSLQTEVDHVKDLLSVY